jgi:hypothetical protein
MDLQDKTMTRLKKDDRVERMNADEGMLDLDDDHEGGESEKDQLHERHCMLVSKYRYELEVQSDNRAEMAKDEDYYDNIQFTLEQIKELEDRGQAPISYNVISQTVNWVIGSEKRGRTDFKILPRTKEDAKPAEVKTKYFKYVSDMNRTNFNRSRSFEDTVKVGVGWIETSVPDEEDDEPTGDRYESWRNMLWDSASTAMDTSDMRYQFRSKWVDLDVAIAMFPHCKEKLIDSVSTISTFGSSTMLDGDDAMDGAEQDRELFGGTGPIYQYKRDRVRLIEAWYRVPEEVTKIKGGRFKGDIYDENDPRHAEAIQTGNGRLYKKVIMRTRVMFMTINHPLYDDVSPFRHNRLKFIPIWGYRRGRDNLPYGIIRGLRDIQDDINKRASKALHILSSNKIMMEEGVLPDDVTIDDFADEFARPDSISVFRNGTLASGKVITNVDRELAPAHLDLMSRNISMIQQVGGVTDELLGRSTNAVSGVAVQKRQDQGSVATNKLFDNLRFAVQQHGEITLSLIEQFVTEEKQFRITNERGTPQYITLNDGLPENDIARAKADFVISEADWRATMRQAALEQLFELLGKLPPQISMVMLDLVVDQMDIENREEIAKRIRDVNGMRDPDATEPTPEEMAKAQAQQKQQQAQEAMFMAELQGKQADAAKKSAEADKAAAGVKLIEAQTVQANMMGAQAAMTAATAVITMPATAKVADNLLLEGGWGGGTPVPPAGLPPAAQGIPQQQPQQQPPAAPMPPQGQPQPPQGA